VRFVRIYKERREWLSITFGAFLLLNGRNERNRSRQPTSWLTCKNGAETFNPRRFQGSEKTALNTCYFMRSFQAILLIFFSCILPVIFCAADYILVSP
jgi:hypothetical protein